MIDLRPTKTADLPRIIELESQADTREFIASDSLDRHQQKMAQDNTTYLTIDVDGDFGGFLILHYELDTNSVECARVAVSAKGQGIGQTALKLMETYCRETFNAKRIWLDVFDFNQRGQHIYRKLGYTQFDTGEYQGKVLIFMEKFLGD